MGGYSGACQDASTTAVVTIIKGWTNSSCIVYMHTTCDRYVLYCIAYHYVCIVAYLCETRRVYFSHLVCH